MIRKKITPRTDWQRTLEAQGCYYHTIDGQQYWDESKCYEFTSKEVDMIDDVTKELHSMCLMHVEEVVTAGDYFGYDFSDDTIALIEKSWQNQHPSIYGRFDLGYNVERGQIKLYEYNADTPTSLPETSIFQWNWLQDIGIEGDQFNSVDERLKEAFVNFLPSSERNYGRLYFAGSQATGHEDWGNLHYLVNCATEAGLDATIIPIDQIGWSDVSSCFTDMNNKEILWLFKLYPWEYIQTEDFGKYIPVSSTLFVEPAWKMLLSTKALLPLLWGKNAGHPNLLAAMPDDDKPITKWIRKPTYGREGANVSEVIFERKVNTEKSTSFNPDYDRSGYVLQEAFDPTVFDGVTPVIGSWIINNQTAGMGIREDRGFTTNMSRFIPHYFL